MRKTVCITGATSGVGYACAQRFFNAGYDLILLARTKEKLLKMQKQLGGNTVIIDADIGDREALHKGLEAVKDRSIDILINNAGVSKNMDVLREANTADRDEMIDTNIKGTLYITRYILPHMIARKSGHVVNISSISAEQTYRGGNVYCMTKAAINMLAKCLRDELKNTGVRLINVMPGLIDTNFQLYRFDGDQEKANAKIGGRNQLSADEVADAIFTACEKGFAFSNIEIVKE